MPRCINHEGFDNGKPTKADRRASARLREQQRGAARATKFAGDNGSSETILPKKQQSAPKKATATSQRTGAAVASSASDSSDEDETPQTTNRFAGLVEDSDSD